MKYRIYAGLYETLGSVDYIDTIEFESEADAENYAWECACETYESYIGLHGIRGIDEIMEDDGVDEEEAIDIFNEEREDWLSYYVREHDENRDYDADPDDKDEW